MHHESLVVPQLPTKNTVSRVAFHEQERSAKFGAFDFFSPHVEKSSWPLREKCEVQSIYVSYVREGYLNKHKFQKSQRIHIFYDHFILIEDKDPCIM